MRGDNAIQHISTEWLRQGRAWILFGTAFILVYLPTAAPAAQVTLTQGHMVRLKLHDVLTTENVMKGDPIQFDVAEDVVVATHVLIQKGAPAIGKVLAVKGQGKRNTKDAAVTFEFESVRSVDNQVIKLRKLSDRHKKGESKENEVQANEPLPGYAERRVGAEKGKEYVAYVDVTATVNAPDTPVAPPPVTTAATPPTSTPPGTTPPAAAPSNTPSVAPMPALTEDTAIVDFKSDPPGADILIDGVLVGNTPSALHVAPGHRLIQLRIGGYTSWTRTMVVEPGSYPAVRATLQKQ